MCRIQIHTVSLPRKIIILKGDLRFLVQLNLLLKRRREPSVSKMTKICVPRDQDEWLLLRRGVSFLLWNLGELCLCWKWCFESRR